MLCMLCGMQAVAQNVEKEFPEEDAQVYLEPEVLPVFPGGTEELMKYLRENVKYPHVCQQQGIQGSVIVQFVVNADGSIDDATVVKPVNVFLDREALRVINAMPKWEPGVKDGKAVRVRFTIPITFKLDFSKQEKR